MSDERLLIDTNIVMYAGGGEHRYKESCAGIILSIADRSFWRNFGIPVTDTEVFQEILYRYALTGKWETGIAVCRDFLALGLELLPIGSHEVEKVLELAQAYKGAGIPPRDLIHTAVMINHGIEKIISVDSHFELIREVRRIDPQGL